jgi:toxin YhaV
VTPLKHNGWEIYFHPLFERQFLELRDEVKSLKGKLSTKKFNQHPKVKMLLALKRGISEEIPSNPYDSRFCLTGDLKGYGRLKRLGLSSRYRLFFRAFSMQKAIVIIWLGFPRKEGSREDCYEKFKKMINRYPAIESWADLLDENLS